MSTSSIGRAREYRARDWLITQGWVLVSRSAASKGAADLIMVHPLHGVALIQVGSVSKTLGPADRTSLCNLAALCGALPLLAIVTPRQPIRLWEVTRGAPATWRPWPNDLSNTNDTRGN